MFSCTGEIVWQNESRFLLQRGKNLSDLSLHIVSFHHALQQSNLLHFSSSPKTESPSLFLFFFRNLNKTHYFKNNLVQMVRKTYFQKLILIFFLLQTFMTAKRLKVGFLFLFFTIFYFIFQNCCIIHLSHLTLRLFYSLILSMFYSNNNVMISWKEVFCSHH